MTNKAILIFSGYNQRAVVAFMRTLENLSIPYTVIASSPEDPLFNTIYKRRITAIRSVKQLDFNDIAMCMGRAVENTGFREFTIAPSTEALNRFLIDNKDEFAKLRCSIPLVSKELYKNISDKYSFGELCVQGGINTPHEYGSIEEAIIPFVAKPYSYTTADGQVYSPILIQSEGELNDFKKEHDLNNFYFQKFIEGESLYLLYYLYRDGSVVKLSQQNYIQQAEGKSIIAAMSIDFHESQESLKYENMLRKLKYFGLIMIEVKHSQSGYIMIEANPRFWGPSQLFVDTGVNLFEDFLFDNGFLEKKPTHDYKPSRYFWGGGAAIATESHKPLVYHSYSEQQFVDEIQLWEAADVYNRADTKELFMKETKV